MAWLGAALGGLLLLGGGGLYFALASPAPTSARLLAAAKAEHGESLQKLARQELCLSNLNYSEPVLNVAQYDRNTQQWLKVLVLAGLYQPGTPAMGGGFFAQPVVQYAATAELSKWRKEERLCLSQKIDIVDVVQISVPAEQKREMRGGEGAGAPIEATVSAKLVLQAGEVAPWLGVPEVQGPVLERFAGWEYQDGKLQKQIADTFGLRDGQWVTGAAYEAALLKQLATERNASQDRAQNARSASDSGGFLASLGQLFSFGGHPLVGTWRLDTSDLDGLLGAAVQMSGVDPRLTFTRDSMELDGKVTRCTFEVDGQRVKVTAHGENTGQIFVLRDKNTAVLDMDVMQLTYKRVP